MNGIELLLTVVCAGLMFSLPRRLGVLPLLIAASYVPLGNGLDIAGVQFSITRILIAAGFLRVIFKGERIAGRFNRLDGVIIAWAACMVLTGFFHKNLSAAIILRLGTIFDCLGIYFLVRVFVREMEDIHRVARMICIILVPVALAMIFERLTGKNLFGMIFGGSTEAAIRNGHFRARGPFIHAILAGTIGAVCMTMPIWLWKRERRLALIGIAATGAIVIASGSSGPLMTAITICGALALWKWRRHLRVLGWASAFLIIALDLVMNDPVYFLMARIDITGGSTGYHRAALIRSTIEHLGEWWLIGTDYTRHWMASGIYSNEDHTDITNHYIAMGVMGGIPLLLAFVLVLVAAFLVIGRALRLCRNGSREREFLIWTLAATLFAHAATFMSISYFGQILVVFYLLLGTIGSIRGMRLVPVLKPKAPANLFAQKNPNFN